MKSGTSFSTLRNAMGGLLLALLSLHTNIQAQHATNREDSSWETLYRATPQKINDLVHTKIEAKFDYDKAYMYGKAWITLRPHFYPTDSLTLDAKGMEIKSVSLRKGSSGTPLQYEYDGMELRIKLGKSFTRNQEYTIHIDYVAKPNEYKGKGSVAITDAKGLYFINPRGEEKNKPTQIWTQGETEATSVWCPTIDKPNQKTTQEISMTVPAKYVTLSNGKLISQKKNSDGTRTDIWKMDLPHAPYLFFMGAGEYAIVKDQYKGKEVSYYVEKEYESVARKIFGNTPEMMQFFSKVLGMEYPWNKYAQIVGRDYVSGAMENTTATLHQESAQQDARELVDENSWEGTIAHELFHHWFGDYVTAESWSNLTLNESFANYSQVLWKEYKYGKDAGDEENFNDMMGYLMSGSDKKDLVRYYYKDKEAMFDAVSYNKGGRILNMLRNYVGDSAFYKALNVYLTRHKLGTAEAAELRLAFEEVTGMDMNWFWNQWYFSNGHPKLVIDYVYDDNAKNVKVIVQQKQEQPAFRLPIYVDIYNGSQKARHRVWLENKADTFTFNYTTRPDLVNVDGDRILLAEKTDNKTLANYIHQYQYAGTYLDRREAIDYAAQYNMPEALAFLQKALNDKYEGLRIYALRKLDMQNPTVRKDAEPILARIAEKDPKSLVRATALSLLATYNNPVYQPLFARYVKDSSYSVAGSALEGLFMVDKEAALQEVKKLKGTKYKGRLMEAVVKVLAGAGDTESFDDIMNIYESMPGGQAKFDLIHPLTQMMVKVDETARIKRCVDKIVEFRNSIPAEYGIGPYIDGLLRNVITAKKNSGQANAAEQIEYINSKIAK